MTLVPEEALFFSNTNSLLKRMEPSTTIAAGNPLKISTAKSSTFVAVHH